MLYVSPETGIAHKDTKLTPEDRERIVQLFAEGLSQNHIGKLFSVDRSTIRYHLNRANVRRPGFSQYDAARDRAIYRKRKFKAISDADYEAIVRKQVAARLAKVNASQALVESTIRMELEAYTMNKSIPPSYVDYLLIDLRRNGVTITRSTVAKQVRHRRIYGF